MSLARGTAYVFVVIYLLFGAPFWFPEAKRVSGQKKCERLPLVSEMVTGREDNGHAEAVAEASDEPKKKPQKSEKSLKSLQSEKSEKDGVQLALTCNAYATKGA